MSPIFPPCWDNRSSNLLWNPCKWFGKRLCRSQKFHLMKITSCISISWLFILDWLRFTIWHFKLLKTGITKEWRNFRLMNKFAKMKWCVNKHKDVFSFTFQKLVFESCKTVFALACKVCFFASNNNIVGLHAMQLGLQVCETLSAYVCKTLSANFAE